MRGPCSIDLFVDLTRIIDSCTALCAVIYRIPLGAAKDLHKCWALIALAPTQRIAKRSLLNSLLHTLRIQLSTVGVVLDNAFRLKTDHNAITKQKIALCLCFDRLGIDLVTDSHLLTSTRISVSTSSPANAVVRRTFSFDFPVFSGTTGKRTVLVLDASIEKHIGSVDLPDPAVVHISSPGSTSLRHAYYQPKPIYFLC